MLNWIFVVIFKLMGWKLNPNIPQGVNRCVMIAAPHTSNWDIIFARAAFSLMGIPLRFTIKKEWMRFPFNLLVGPMGGIPIDRSPKNPGEDRKSMVEAMADLFTQHQRIAVMVTPEGTRGRRTEWKTGFYHVAKLAGVPIGLGYLDYAKKEAGVGLMIYPGENMEEDMRQIMQFYKDIPAKHQEKFSVDERYI
jgi:1-acyl-sn-glycerol-3-phosphate acyltransferase